MKIDYNQNGRFARPGDKVELGRLLLTEGVIERIEPNDAAEAVRRHAEGDWGLLDAEDREANEQALKTGGRLLSRYVATTGEPFWVITEADRSATTVLLPEEY